MSISDLSEIKRVILAEHKKYEDPYASEYREGILTGINVALMRIESMIEEEDARMVREYSSDVL